MKKFLMVITLLIALLFPITLFAQEEEESNLTATTQYFDISMERISQSAFTKAVTYVIYVTPKIDSSRTQVLWDAPTSIEINPKHKEFVDMYRGQTYELKAKVKAKRSGTYEISVNLIAWQHDTNYTNSVSDLITFNNDLVATPISPSYTYSLIAKYLIIAIVTGLSIWGLVVFGKKGLNALKKWLTPPK
jgi:hypothetical protein